MENEKLRLLSEHEEICYECLIVYGINSTLLTHYQII